MPKRAGKSRRAAAARRRYDNLASAVEVRQHDANRRIQAPLDTRDLARTVVEGNKQADPRPRSNRRTWSAPGN